MKFEAKTKKIIAVVLSICVLFTALVPGGGIRALATALNQAIRGSDIQNTSQYYKTNIKAKLGSEDNPFIVLEIVPTEDQALWGYYFPDCEPVNMKEAQMLYDRYNILKPLVQQNPIFSAEEAEEFTFYDEIAAGEFVLDGPSQDLANKGNWMSLKDYYPDYKDRGFDLEHSGANYGQWQIKTNKDKQGNPYHSEQGIYKLVGPEQGNFRLEDGKYIYDPSVSGTYIWIPKNKISSEDSSETLVTRTDKYVFLRRYMKMTNNDQIVSKMYSAKSDTFTTKVVTVTPQQLQSTMDADGKIPLIEEADLISIHNLQEYADLVRIYHRMNDKDNPNPNNGATFFNTSDNDLTYDVTMALLKRMASGNPASLMLQKPLMWQPQVTDGISVEQSNLHKLVIMLLQYQPKKFMQIFGNYLTKETINGYDKVVYRPDYSSSTIKEFTNTTFAVSPTNQNQNMYSEMRLLNVNSGGTDLVDHIMTTQGDPIVSELLNDGKNINYTTYNPNNQYGDWSNNTTSEGFEYFDKGPGDTLSLLEGLEYILQPQQYTPKLRVLEIQPCDKFVYMQDDNWEEYYQKLFPWYKPSTDVEGGWLRDSDLIEVTTMPTWEFIGSVGRYDYKAKNSEGNTKLLTADSSDDLLAKYDLIIIGSKQDVSNGGVVPGTSWYGYNQYSNAHPGTNINLEKLIYTSVGGALWNGTMDATQGNNSEYMNPSEYMDMHYSGNDITLKKMHELQDFLRAGKPVVVDEGLYGSDGKISTEKVDKNSKLYDLLTWVDNEVVTTVDDNGNTVKQERHAEENIFRHDKIKSASMKKLINGNLCRLEFVDDEDAYPVAYEYTSETKNGITGVIRDEIYQGKNADGQAVLVYHFYIAGTSTQGYRAYLNVDVDGDGVYSGSLKENSKVDNMNAAMKADYQYDTSESPMSLRFYASKTDMKKENQLGTSDTCVLQPYTTYYATVDIPKERQGIIPWKFEVQEVQNEYLRSSAVNYTAVLNSEKDSINVLQMSLYGNMKDGIDYIKNDMWGTYGAFCTFTKESIVVKPNETYESFNARRIENGGLPETDNRIYNELTSNEKRTVQKFETYLEPVQEFDVNIHFMYNSDWKTLFYTSQTDDNNATYKQKLEDWKDFLSHYDMVVFGFIDQSSFTSDKVYVEGIKDFIDQGKGVILSHDTVTGSHMLTFDDPVKRGVYGDYATWLRTTAGQRRTYYNKQSDGTYKKSYNSTKVNGQNYTTTGQININNSYWKKFYRKFSKAIDGNTVEEEFYGTWVNEWMDNCNQLAIRTLKVRGNGDNYAKDRIPKGQGALNASGWGNQNAWSTAFVKLTNNGQITTYPYTLDPVIEVLMTHTQNYQLDMEFMEYGDVNVWFNLTDRNDDEAQAHYGGIDKMPNTSNKSVNIYSARDQDCRNSFYIYNKGNITYTGSGHGKIDGNGTNGLMTDEEVQLFVNTMIAAYRPPDSKPYVEVDNADSVTVDEEYQIYVDYDGSNPNAAIDGKLETVNGEEMVRVELSVHDIKSAMASNIHGKQYYLDVKSAETDAKSDYALYGKEGQSGAKLARNTSGKAEGWYNVDASLDGVQYVLYLPYKEVRDNTSVSVVFETYATYVKGGKSIKTSVQKTKATVMLLPLYDLR